MEETRKKHRFDSARLLEFTYQAEVSSLVL
jgi:hypothetical protein